MKVALLGLGRMGQSIAHRLIEDGHELTVWNRSKGKADELVAAGAHEAAAPADAVAPAEVVITMLSNDDAVRELVLGAEGIAARLGARLYVDASTTSPALAKELEERIDRYVALPVLGAPAAVREGTATYLAGGPPELIGELRPVLASLGKHKEYGRPELATAAKLTVNLVLLSAVATLAEAFSVGRAGGLSDEQLSELFSDSPMIPPGVKNRFEAILTGKGPVWWTTVLAAKDAALAVELGSDVRLRIAPELAALYQQAAEGGLESEDMASVARLYRSS